jgi:AraC-like DNA-binding protein
MIRLVKKNIFSDRTISFSVLSQLLRYQTSIGIKPDPDLIGLSDDRISAETHLSIEEKAAAMTGDPCFGLHVGQFYTPGSWSLLDYIVMNSRTLGDALILSQKYTKIVSPIIKTGIKLRPGAVEIILTVPVEFNAVSHYCYHTVMANIVQMVRKLTGEPLSPIRACFRDPEPSIPVQEEFSAFFDCPLFFGHGHYSIVFHPSFRNIRLPQSDPAFLQYFQDLASDILRQIEKNGSSTEAVISLIVTKLRSEDLSIRSIAREMGMSVRSLQLKLAEERTVFSDLLTQTRERLARKYLGENSTVEETAFLLGFSDPSSFCKAFKKWTGLTPGEYRREMKLAGVLRKSDC